MKDIDEKQQMKILMIESAHQMKMDISCINVAGSEFIAPWMIMYEWCAFRGTCNGGKTNCYLSLVAHVLLLRSHRNKHSMVGM